MARINKSKYKDGKMYIEYQKINKQGGYDDFTLRCAEPPRPEYEKAIEKLCPFVIDLCELPPAYLSKITVKSVSFSYGGEAQIMGAVISASMALKNSNAPLNLNTPHKPSDLLPRARVQGIICRCAASTRETIPRVVHIRARRALN